MNRWAARWIGARTRPRAAAVLTILALAPLRADLTFLVPTDPSSNVVIKLSSPVTTVPRFGFVPIRISIENLASRDGEWKFRFNAGSPGSFPGVAGSTFELAVPSAQTREAWCFVPLAEPGLSANPLAAALPSVYVPVSSLASPPLIDTVWPTSPPGVTPPFLRTATTSSRTGGITRTFTITQTGPAAKLPPLPPAKLPLNTTVNLSAPNAAGEVTRTTIVSVDSGTGGGPTYSVSNSATSGLMSAAVSNARSKLIQASGLYPAGARSLRTSARSGSPGADGLTDFTVTLVQTGSAADLPLPDVKTLPPGFTGVTVNPTSNPGEVVREFTYVERMAVPVMSISPSSSLTRFSSYGGGVAGGSPFMSTVAAEAEARRILAPTGLLAPLPGVTSAPAQAKSVLVSGGSSGPTSSSNAAVMTFEQAGPTAALAVPPATSLPPTVRVSLHPTLVPGTSIRVISVVDPMVLRALQANIAAASLSSSSADRRSLAQVELMRLGYWRYDAKVTQSMSQRSSPAATVGVAPDILIYTESGPDNLLPAPPAGVLPAGITCRVTPGLMPGEVARNFIVDTSVLAAAVATLPVVTVGPGATPAPVPSTPIPRVPSGAMNLPPALSIEVTGPGVTRQVNFPGVAPSALPPMAVASGLDAVVRAKLAGAGLRTVPNFAPVEPAQLPADWRVWSSFNSLLLKAEDFAGLDAGRRGALRGWVALGGILYLTPAVAGRALLENIGAGRIETFATPVVDSPPREVATALQLGTLSPGMPNRDLLRLAPGTPMGDIVKFEGAEVLWLSVFLILFAVLIGPVNIFLLAPAGKRHRLFFTTPLLSVLGAVAVAGAIVFQDGFGGDGVRRALVVLVPGENQAAVFQEQATHTGFLTRRDFALEDGVLFAVLPTDEVIFINPLVPGVFVREKGQASGEWFRNRSRQAQLLRHVTPTRARIELVEIAPGGAPVVESTLATELRNFHLRDEAGGYWFADSVRPGRRVTLKAGMASAVEAATREFGGDGTVSFTTAMGAAALRSSWQWTARGGATDLAPIPTLKAIRWKEHQVTYTGVAERSGAGSPPRAAGDVVDAPAAGKDGQ